MKTEKLKIFFFKNEKVLFKFLLEKEKFIKKK